MRDSKRFAKPRERATLFRAPALAAIRRNDNPTLRRDFGYSLNIWYALTLKFKDVLHLHEFIALLEEIRKATHNRFAKAFVEQEAKSFGHAADLPNR